jgi:hypothetical protein
MQFFKGDEVKWKNQKLSLLVIEVKEVDGKLFADCDVSSELIPVDELVLVRRYPAFYGDNIVGVWHCNRCTERYYPRQLYELGVKTFECPTCQVGELIYDEEA